VEHSPPFTCNVNSGEWSNSLSIVHFVEQWNRGPDEEEGRREGGGKQTEQFLLVVLLVAMAVVLRLLTSGSYSFFCVFCISSSASLCSPASLFLLLFLTMMVLLLTVARGGGVASNGREKRTKKEGGYCSSLLLYFFVFLFFSFAQIFLLCSSMFSAYQVLKQTSPSIFPKHENVLRFPLFFFPQPPLYFLSFCFCFCFCFLFFSLFFPSISTLCSSPFPGIYKKEKRERELLPLSSHGIRVGWPDDH